MWPVVVRRVAIKDKWGECQFWKDPTPFFRIKLDPALTGERLAEVLIHEWGHCLSWSSEHPDFLDHSAEWGVAYARIYSALIEP